jgi:bacterioferritin-associated ferredoxin
MYICLCNGLTDGKVRMVARRAECSVAEVYRALGCKPQCGKCVPFVRDLIREAADDRNSSSVQGFSGPANLLSAGADC